MHRHEYKGTLMVTRHVPLLWHNAYEYGMKNTSVSDSGTSPVIAVLLGYFFSIRTTYYQIVG